MRRSLLCICFLMIIPFACEQPDDGPDAAIVSIRIEPANAILRIQDSEPVSQTFLVFAVDENGDEINVTPQATLAIEMTSLGSFDGPTLTTTSNRVGRTGIIASYLDLEARVETTIITLHVVEDPLMPDNIPERFEMAQPGISPPTLVYPSSNVMVPSNLGSIEFHFLPGGTNDIFAVDFVGDLQQIRFYTYCRDVFNGCYFAPNADAWSLLLDAGRGQAPLYYSVTGIDSSLQTPLASTSDSRTIGFSFYDVQGGLYYWAASSGAVMRYDFGLAGQYPERFLDTAQTGATECVGCHALSRDGSLIAVGLDIPGPAEVETYVVATRERMWNVGGALGGGANFFTYSPDNSALILSNGISMSMHDAQTGDHVADISTRGTMPDWSPDGQHLIYTRPVEPVQCPVPQFCSAVSVNQGELVLTDTATWQTTDVLVPSTSEQNNYYPSFSPDSEWIVYNQTLMGSSYDAQDARIWAVHRSGGPPLQLHQASPEPGGDSWPKWSPFVDEYYDGQLMWLTFSSTRDYGLRTSMPTQVWMVAFDPARANAGLDPSFAAFWLPFQNPLSSNHIAQWVEQIDRMPCDAPEDCPTGEICEQGFCRPDIQ